MTVSEQRKKLRQTINNMLNIFNDDYINTFVYEIKASILLTFAQEIGLISKKELLRYENNIRDKEPII